MPGWVQTAYGEYVKRLPPEINVDTREIPLAARRKGESPERAMALEGRAILKALTPSDHVVALAIKGESWSTVQLAQNLASWQGGGSDICFLIGGPDGLHQTCSARAHQQVSLSAMTLPHPLVRVVLVEQLYRAWSINAGHPYHR
jgi:23S rRNA (pseudouridine1915-N3)-methyltransferase